MLCPLLRSKLLPALAAAMCFTAVAAAPVPPLAFVGVNVVPMDAESVLTDQTVIVSDGRITALGPSAATAIPRGARRIDGKGRYLLPGLADMHAHLAVHAPQSGAERDAYIRSELLLYLATGVTLVRNMAGSPTHLNDRRRVASGEFLGPRIFTATPILDGPNAVWSFATKVADPSEVEALVAGFQRDGYDQIKIYNELSRPVYAALLDAAARHEIRVVGHVPFSVGIDAALAAGQYSIEHLRGYDYDGVRPQALILNGGRNAERFGSWLRMSEDRMRDLARKTEAAKTWNTPTFVVNDMLSDPVGRAALTRHPLIRFVRPEIRAKIESNELDAMFDDGSKAAIRASFPPQYRFLKMLSDAGAGLLIGTDTAVPFLVPGYTPIDELRHFVAAGLSPYQALRAATAGPAQFMGIAAESGTIAPGKRADMILVAGNPLEDIAHLRELSGVVLQGQWLSQRDLRRRLEAMAATYPKAGISQSR